MTHTDLLGLQIKMIIFCFLHLDRYPLCDLNAKGRQLIHFIRVIGK